MQIYIQKIPLWAKNTSYHSDENVTRMEKVSERYKPNKCVRARCERVFQVHRIFAIEKVFVPFIFNECVRAYCGRSSARE